jgi:hypothetical protein
LAALIALAAGSCGSTGSGTADAPNAEPVAPFVLDTQNPDNPQNADAHWHTALGVFDCDHWVGDTTGEGLWAWPTATSTGAPARAADPEVYAGLHSHNDGLVHIEAAAQEDAGVNATLGRYFEYGGWKLSEDGFSFLDTTVKNGDECGGEAAELWWYVNGEHEDGNPADYKLGNDEVVVLAFLGDGTYPGDPPSAVNLGVHGSGGTPPGTVTVPRLPGTSADP